VEINLELPIFGMKLYLAGNNLSRIPIEEWNDTDFRQISLSRNPWLCDCGAWTFRQWLILRNSSIQDLYEVRCGGNGKFSNEIIIHLTYTDLCPSLSHIDSTTIIIVNCVVWLLIIFIFICCFRKSLAAVLYSCGCACVKHEEQHEYLFDAFLLYADEDDEFALGKITEGLEEDSAKYKLFIPTRQVLLTSSPVNINSSISDCCKVIVVLTSAFLRNTQCMQLLKTAMSYSMESSYQRFIFITTEGLPSEIKFDLLLNSLLKKSVRLRWGELLFWLKIKYNLPKKLKATICDEDAEQLLQ